MTHTRLPTLQTRLGIRRNAARACATLVALAVLLPLPGHAQGRPATVMVERVEPRRIQDTRPVIGQLVPTRTSALASRVAGIIEKVGFDIGDRVRKGDTLVSLDKRKLAIAVRAAEAAASVAEAGLQVAEAKLKRAQMSFDRQAALKKSTAFSRSIYDDLEQATRQAESERAQAQAQLLSARANLDAARYEVEHSVITAPFDGIVTARQAQPGQYLQIGATIANLIDIASIEIEADVPGMVASDLAPGTKVSGLIENGKRIEALVRATIPVQNTSTRTRVVRLRIDPDTLPETLIAAGSTVTLQVPVSAPRRVNTVPKDALIQGSNGWMVYVVEDNKALPRTVSIGQPVSERMEVISGLDDNDVVVVRGNERLRPGQPVEAKPAPAPPGAEKG